MVIQVKGFGLVILGKTCRLCLRCNTLIAHEADILVMLNDLATKRVLER